MPGTGTGGHLSGIKEAIAAAFPKTEYQRCIVHQVRNTLKYVPLVPGVWHPVLKIGEGKVYLSPIIDCFDGMPITWTVGTSPNAELVNTMLDNAIVLLKENEHPIVHSDRGCHYRWSGWIQRMDEAGLTRSMSKKGCSPDNSACEGFFGRMKNEMFYGEKWDKISVEEFISIINQYMQWYRDKRIKLSLGGLSPMEYRRSLGIA